MMVELAGLDDIPWSQLGHAYGSAQDVPLHLRRLASNNKERQEDALWKLTAAIFHQGDIYDSSVAAIPYPDDVTELAEADVAVHQACLAALMADRERLSTLTSDPNPEIAELGRKILPFLE